MSSQLTVSQHDHRKSGCWYANAVVTSSQTAAHRMTSTGQQQLSPTPTLRKLPHSSPDIVSRQHHVFTTTASPNNLQGTQLEVYTTVRKHFTSTSPPSLHLIITGTAGTGKSYLIQCLRLLLSRWPPPQEWLPLSLMA